MFATDGAGMEAEAMSFRGEIKAGCGKKPIAFDNPGCKDDKCNEFCIRTKHYNHGVCATTEFDVCACFPC